MKQQLEGMVTLKRDPYLDGSGGRHGAGGEERRKKKAKKKAGEQSGTDL